MRADASREATFLRIGALCAIAGTVLSVAGGVGFGNLTNEQSAEAVLRVLVSRPDWYWPAVHLSFIVGAILWVGAFIALASSLTRGVAWALGRWGAVAMVIGAAIHIVDSSISGFALTALASDWESAPAPERASLLLEGQILLRVLNATWPSVHGYFHGLPFILSGVAVARSAHYPGWFGWIGVAGGLGSIGGGMLIFLGVVPQSERLVILFAQLVSLWMLGIGVLMWRRAGAAEQAAPAMQGAE